MSYETQYGYKIPELEDKDFWDSYNWNFLRLDGHTHDGEDSAFITVGEGAGVYVATEAELDAAIADLAPYIIFTSSFTVTSRKTLYNNVKIEGRSTNVTLTGSGITAGQSILNIPPGVSGIIIQGITINTLQTDIDVISIQDTAVRNLICDCILTTGSTTTRSVFYIAGQQNRITSNNSDFGKSLTSPGNIFLDVTSSQNVVNGNIFT